MSAQILAERIRALAPLYDKMFAERGGVVPSDPLKFHLYHLALYWSRLVGFCRQDPSNPANWIEGDLGACVQIGSESANQLIGTGSPLYGLWQDYWSQTQAILHARPVTIEAVESASQAFNTCLAEAKYDPWATKKV
jgi:hypothetical protein